jgi:hypothetical protein
MTTTKPKVVPVRLPPAMVARIDALKGDLVPREAYVRHLLNEALDREEKKRAKARR